MSKEEIVKKHEPVKQTQSSRKGESSLSWIMLLSTTVLIISIWAWNPKALFAILANYYNKWVYLPQTILNHYIENPLSDVSFTVPIYFESEFIFPDLPEAVDIQVNSRMQNEFFTLLNYTIQLIPGTREKYGNDAYPEDDLFLYCRLNTNNAIQVDGAKNFAELYFNLEGVDSNDVPFFMTQLLVDHCFRDEISKYAPDAFYKLKDVTTTVKGQKKTQAEDKYHLEHADFMSQEIIPALLKTKNHKVRVYVKIHVVGAKVFSIDMEEAVEKFMYPLFDSLSEFFNFNVSINEVNMEDSEALQRLNETDQVFPVELVNLPVIWDLYQKTKFDSEESDGIVINMVFYPFLQGGELIKEISIDSSPIYSDFENTSLRVGNWGSIYFSHISQDDAKTASPTMLQDCVWSFNENLLDTLGVPDDNLAPAVRSKIFKRYVIMQYFVYYSSLLSELRSIVSRNDLSGLANTDPTRVKYLAEAFVQSLEKRKQSSTLVKDGDLSGSLAICREMVDILHNALYL